MLRCYSRFQDVAQHYIEDEHVGARHAVPFIVPKIGRTTGAPLQEGFRGNKGRTTGAPLQEGFRGNNGRTPGAPLRRDFGVRGRCGDFNQSPLSGVPGGVVGGGVEEGTCVKVGVSAGGRVGVSEGAGVGVSDGGRVAVSVGGGGVKLGVLEGGTKIVSVTVGVFVSVCVAVGVRETAG
jgi:hypothetical protein